jgi:hypothetical protein
MDIKEVIKECQEHFKDPPPNEAATCEWVILPLLYASGYQKRDVLARSIDVGGKYPDYTLLPNNAQHQFYLEAKSWETNLEDSHANQALNYANQNGKRWVLLSNGRIWRLYDNDIRGVAEDKLATEVNLRDAEQAFMFFIAMGKDSVCADRLPGFASAEVERREKETHEKQLLEEKNRRQDLLHTLLEEELRDEQSQLVHLIVDCLSKRAGLEEITLGEVVVALGGKESGEEEPPGGEEPPVSTEAEIKHKAMLITINKLYRSNMSPEELYEVTRGIWVVGKDRDRVELALAVYQGIVREVYRVSCWEPAGSRPYKTLDSKGYKGSGRWEFVGEVAGDVRDAYINKSVRKYLRRGSQNPIKYVNVKNCS